MKRLISIFAGFLIAVAARPSPGATVSGVTDYTFEPVPREITPKMYNWEVILTGADSTNGSYEIVQINQHLSEGGTNPATTNVLIDSGMVVPSAAGIIHFKLHVGDKEPKQNMNGPGRLGQPISFSGIGTGKGASNWIVLQGPTVDRVAASGKGTELADGKLVLIRFDLTDTSGEKIQTVVMLRRKPNPK